MQLISPTSFLVVALVFLACTPANAAQLFAPIFGITNLWRFNQTNNLDSTGWEQPSFDDSVWQSGPGALAFETNSLIVPLIHTTVRDPRLPPTGQMPGSAFYFRTHFFLDPATATYSLIFSNRIDDGAVVYINGVRAATVRCGIPSLHNTLASNTPPSGDAIDWEVFTVDDTALYHSGDNVLAVSVHQASTNSTDIFFGTILTATPLPPLITSPPQSQTVHLHQQAAFGVIATGTGPLRYQWQKDGSPINGATNAQFALAHAQFADAGRYSVVVFNAYGSATSTNGSLTVIPPSAGDLDYSFDCTGTPTGAIQAIAIQPDGKLVIGGWFTNVQGVARGRVARLNADGSIDDTFMTGLPGTDGPIESIALQDDGKAVIAGYFGSVNGVTREGIARLNRDGTLDTSFLAGLSGGPYSVGSVALQSDGKVLIAGTFTSVNGTWRKYLARLHANGALDDGFHPDIYGVAVNSIQESGGALFIGGWFDTVDGYSHDSIAKLHQSGTPDNGFQAGILRAGYGIVDAIAVDGDGKVLIGGRFTNVNSVARNRIARLNADGSLDATFGDGLSGADNAVNTLVVQSDRKVLIGGYFSTVNVGSPGTELEFAL